MNFISLFDWTDAPMSHASGEAADLNNYSGNQGKSWKTFNDEGLTDASIV